MWKGGILDCWYRCDVCFLPCLGDVEETKCRNIIFVSCVRALREKFLESIFLMLSLPRTLFLNNLWICVRVLVVVGIPVAAGGTQQLIALSIDGDYGNCPAQCQFESRPLTPVQLLWIYPAMFSWISFCPDVESDVWRTASLFSRHYLLYLLL